MALSVEYRTRDQEVVGLSLGRACGVKTYVPLFTKQYKLVPAKGSGALRLGSKGRYGLCVGGR